MTISEDELQTLCKLAYLDSGCNNAHELVNEINNIIDFVEQLKSVNTTQVAPLFHPMELHQHLREDKITEEDCAQELAKIAPLFDDGFYWVPKVLDDKE